MKNAACEVHEASNDDNQTSNSDIKMQNLVEMKCGKNKVNLH